MTFLEAYNKFREIEDKFNLFEQRIQDFPFWDYLRISVFQQLLCSLENRDSHNRCPLYGDKKAIPRLKKNKAYGHIFKNTILKNPFLAGNCDYLFLGNPRRKIMSDNTYWDIYSDPIIEHLGPDKCLILESRSNGYHLTPAHTKRLAYTEALDVYRKLSNIKPAQIKLNEVDNNILAQIENSFKIYATNNEYFNISKKVVQSYQEHQINFTLFNTLLKKLKPKAVFLVCSYGKESQIAVCKKNGLPTIELQHGTIGPMHVGYSFPYVGAKKTFPDYLFSFGDFWKENAAYSIDKNQIFTIGYPHINSYLNEQKKTKKKKITFISQATIGKGLSRLAVKLFKRLPSEWELVYKLHPREIANWQNEYPELAASGIKVISNEPPSLYELLSESQIQIGVYSTAVFEGLALGCQTYLVNLPGVQSMQPLIDQGICTLINSTEEIDFGSASPSNKFQKDYFFADNWQDNFDKAMAAIGLEIK